MDDFIDSLPTEVFEKLGNFFNTMPRLTHVLQVKNPKTEVTSEVVVQGTRKFFFIALSHTTLASYYELNFALMHHHKYSLTELEEMLPWEREIYIGLLMKYLREEEERSRQQAARR